MGHARAVPAVDPETQELLDAIVLERGRIAERMDRLRDALLRARDVILRLDGEDIDLTGLSRQVAEMLGDKPNGGVDGVV